jgi:hypothetical protein
MPALPQRELSRAVLIGTSDFQHSERLPSLPAVRQNLTDLCDALTNGDTGILDREQCVLIDTPDSPASLMSRLRRAANQAEDLLLVYYAGHGVRHDIHDDLYLTVRETDPDGLDGTAVPFAWLRDVIEHSPSRTRLLVLDCCYSGLAIGSMSSGGVDVRDVQVSGTCVITSSPRNKISHSPPGERRTAFSGELISLLTNGPRLSEEQLTVQVLFRGLVAAMTNRQLPEPKMRAGDLSGDLLLRRPSGTRKPPPPPPPPPPPRPNGGRPAPPTTGRSSARRFLLWLGFAFFLDMAIGAFTGVIFEDDARNLGIALTMSVIAISFAVYIWLSAKNRRISRDLLNSLENGLARLPTGVLVALLITSLGLAVGGIFTDVDPPPERPDTPLYVSVALVLWFAQFATGAAYAIVRRVR